MPSTCQRQGCIRAGAVTPWMVAVENVTTQDQLSLRHQNPTSTRASPHPCLPSMINISRGMVDQPDVQCRTMAHLRLLRARRLLHVAAARPLVRRCSTMRCRNQGLMSAQDLNIYWGSQTGTAQGFACELANEAAAAGIDAKVRSSSAYNTKINSMKRGFICMIDLSAARGPQGIHADDADARRQAPVSRVLLRHGATPARIK